jgi:hypothetical protein
MNIFQMRDEILRLRCIIENMFGSQDIYPLAMFLTIAGQTAYTFANLSSSVLISVIVESNPLDIAGTIPEVTLVGNTINLPSGLGAGQRVYVIYRKVNP